MYARCWSVYREDWNIYVERPPIASETQIAPEARIEAIKPVADEREVSLITVSRVIENAMPDRKGALRDCGVLGSLVADQVVRFVFDQVKVKGQLRIQQGMLPRRSIKVCSLIAALR